VRVPAGRKGEDEAGAVEGPEDGAEDGALLATTGDGAVSVSVCGGWGMVTTTSDDADGGW
jgi:hypothetical protein